MPASTSTVKKQTAAKLGGSGAKDFPSTCINDHHNNNDSQPSLRDFTGGLKTPVPNDHSLGSDGHSLQCHKCVKGEHDVSSEHDQVTTSNPAKWKWLFLTLTKFDEDDGEDPNGDDLNDISYHAKDDVR